MGLGKAVGERWSGAGEGDYPIARSTEPALSRRHSAPCRRRRRRYLVPLGSASAAFCGDDVDGEVMVSRRSVARMRPAAPSRTVICRPIRRRPAAARTRSGGAPPSFCSPRSRGRAGARAPSPRTSSPTSRALAVPSSAGAGRDAPAGRDQAAVAADYQGREEAAIPVIGCAILVEDQSDKVLHGIYPVS